MRMLLKRLAVVPALAVLLLGGWPARALQGSTGKVPDWRHGYYLFLADPPAGCEACYVPLLITAAPLEEAAKGSAALDGVLVTTYERDSIYQSNGMVKVPTADIQPAPRMVRVRNRSYRYQEIGAREVLRLMENPMGTIPISRPFLRSDLPPGPSLEELIAAFRASN